MHINIHIYIYLYIYCKWIYSHTPIGVYMYIYIYIHKYIYICIHLYIYIHTYTSTCMYIYIYVYIHIHVHVFLHMWVHIYMYFPMHNFIILAQNTHNVNRRGTQMNVQFMHLYMYTCIHIYLGFFMIFLQNVQHVRWHYILIKELLVPQEWFSFKMYDIYTDKINELNLESIHLYMHTCTRIYLCTLIILCAQFTTYALTMKSDEYRIYPFSKQRATSHVHLQHQMSLLWVSPCWTSNDPPPSQVQHEMSPLKNMSAADLLNSNEYRIHSFSLQMLTFMSYIEVRLFFRETEQILITRLSFSLSHGMQGVIWRFHFLYRYRERKTNLSLSLSLSLFRVISGSDLKIIFPV